MITRYAEQIIRFRWLVIVGHEIFRWSTNGRFKEELVKARLRNINPNLPQAACGTNLSDSINLELDRTRQPEGTARSRAIGSCHLIIVYVLYFPGSRRWFL